jgi:RNA recognition motif-containing protein
MSALDAVNIPIMGIKLYVGNLVFETSSEDLQELFAAGTVESGSTTEDRDKGRSRGFGFVEMSSKEEGEAAVAQFNRSKVQGDSLISNAAIVGKRGRAVRPGGRYSIRYEHVPRGKQRGGIPFEMSVGEGERAAQARGILQGKVTEVQGPPLLEDRDTLREVETYFSEIAESRKRSRRVQADIARLKKKTQAIIDKLT